MLRVLIVCFGLVLFSSYSYAQLGPVIGAMGWWMNKGGPELAKFFEGIGLTKPMQAAKAPPPPKSTFLISNPTNTAVQFQMKSPSCPNENITLDPGMSVVLGCTIADDKTYYSLVGGNRYVLHAGHMYKYGFDSDGWPAFIE